MKRIEFIAPVEAMRGNLSGNLDLLYPSEDNKAYEGPVGSVNYARNYAPRFIGAKIAKSGKKYFTVRTKSANHLTAKSKKAMALLGGAGAIYAALLKASALKAQAQAVYVKAQELGDVRSFRAFMMDYIRSALIAHSATISLNIAGASVSIDNPWAKFSGALNINISNTIRVKFWTELVSDGIAFTVDGMKGVCINDDDFDTILVGNYNVLTLAKDSSDYVHLGSASGAYITYNGDYTQSASVPKNGDAYATTTVAPEP